MDLSLEEILKKFQQLRIAVIGDAIVDKDIPTVNERVNPDKKRVPLLRSGVKEKKEIKRVLGGAANVANNIVSFASCDFYDVVGDDCEGHELENLFKKRGIEYFLFYDKERNTIIKNRFYDDEGECRFRWDEEEETPFPISDFFQEKILSTLEDRIDLYNGLVLSDYNKGLFSKNDSGKELASRIINFANSKHKPVIVDMKKQNANFFKKCTVVCPNRREAGEILGVESKKEELFNLGKKIQEMMETRYVLITCDKDGVFIYDDGNSKMLGTYAREVSDHTGAGDSLTAGVALGLSTGLSIYNSAEFGNMIAGIVCEKIGTAYATREEILERYDN